MAHLTHIFQSLILSSQSWPAGFWENILSSFFGVIKDYGWTIVLFTIALKLVLLPLDFYQRKTTLDSSKKQAIIAPELAKLQKKYASNKETLNQKTMELYKRVNYNIVGSCFSMLVTMAVTLAVFITLFSAMNNISQYKIEVQYNSLESAYDTAYDTAILTLTEAESIVIAETAVLNEYENVKEGWLWIKNIWRPDTNASIILSFNKFKDVTKLKAPEGEDAETYFDNFELKYNAVMSPLMEQESGWNGYFILVIMAGVITFFSQMIILKTQAKHKSKKESNIVVSSKGAVAPAAPEVDPAASSAKGLMVVLPVMMILFTLWYSGAFAIYIITNSLVSTISTFGMTKLIHKLDDNKELKQKEESKAPYSR